MYINHQDLSKYWVCDIEANGLLDTVTKVWCMVAKNCATKETLKLTTYADIRSFFERSKDCYIVGHNFISYDAPVLRRLLGVSLPDARIVDTLVLSYLYHPKMPGGHSLEAYGERFGFKKDLFDDFSRFSEQLLERCTVDVELNRRVFINLATKMRSVGFSEASCALEHDTRVNIDEQQQNGFKFDVQAGDQLYARLRQYEGDLAGPIRELFPPVLVEQNRYDRRTKKDGSDFASYIRHLEQFPELRDNGDGTYSTLDWEIFNIGSPKQRLEKLLSLGFVPTKLTKAGKPSVDEDSLVEFSKDSGLAEVQAIADWLVANSRAGMVASWLKCAEGDGYIHGRVFSCGAASRRMRHNDPNTANIPGNEAKYGEECRSLWTARPGRVLVGYDAKSAQMRCFAHYLPNPEDGIRFYEEGRDPHQENADLIGIKRKPIKNVFYANMFGAYPPKLASTAGFTGTKRELEERGTWIQNELYRVTPGLREATDSARAEAGATSEGWMLCLDGGYVRCPGQHAALNYRIQPAEAVLMKTMALIIKREAAKAGIAQLKVGDVHDEGQHDVEPRAAEAFGQICVRAAREAGETYNLRVPFDGDFKVGRTWAETH